MCNGCCTRLCISTSVAMFCVFFTMVTTVFQTVVGTLNLANCPMQPQLPQLLLSVGFSGGLFLLCLFVLSFLICACCPGKTQKNSTPLRVIKWCLIGLAIAAVSTTIVVNSYLVYLYQKDFTVVVVDERDCRRGPCPAAGTARGPNPRVSADAKHPSYCKREFVQAVGFISSPFYVLAHAAGMLLPLIFCVLQLCGHCRCGDQSFIELKSDVDCESNAEVVLVKGQGST